MRIRLKEKGFDLISSKVDHSENIVTVKDNNGYYRSNKYSKILSGIKQQYVRIGFEYSVHNIKNFLLLNDIPFELLSTNYFGSTEPLELKCKRCGEIVFKPWISFNKRKGEKIRHILCPNCDGFKLESAHAIVLKQLFLHEHPDTIVEEKSCINPNTNRSMPTDIVNHRLKIAIEVQSEFHDNRADKDKIKKDYWVARGYHFYDPDIRDYTILEMCQLFFDIKELPEYIEYDYMKKLNLRVIQELLDKNKPVHRIAEELTINPHRIYDNIGNGNLHYSKTYVYDCYTSLVQCDFNGSVIGEYISIEEAARQTGASSDAIGRALSQNRHYSGGSFWFTKEEFEKGDIKSKLRSRFSKYQIPVNKFSQDGQFIKRFETVTDAAKEIGISSAHVYRVVIGDRKTIRGFHYEAA